jgi:heterodisulfide reductase subunit B
MGLDDPEHPTILEEMLAAIGCEVVDFPHKVECCGSYLGLSSPDVAIQISREILEMAKGSGADALALACPLCAYNLGDRQEEMREMYPSFEGIPVVYFTQLLGMAVEVGEEVLPLEELAR